MPIPDFQTLMLPLLEFVSDGKEHISNEIEDFLAEKFNLSDEDRQQMLPSGKQQVFTNRVAWAKADLKGAKLIDSPKRSFVSITERGKKIIESKPSKIDRKLLKQFDEYNFYIGAYKNDDKVVSKNDNNVISTNDSTPDEILESSYHTIRKNLASELLSKLKSMNPYRFEVVVVELLVKMGYGGSITEASKAIKKSGDEGIDGVISEDKLGLDIIYIQAKRWENVVGRPELHKFVGALAGQGAKKGIFITTSHFSKDALEYNPKNDTKIVLIDGIKLADLMIDYNLGVSKQNIYEVKKLDTDYFEED
ncbi:MAG: restriction endonuclease [Sphingobacteriales bacterium]|nr:restriction endonuclease [Sphingobacteriales bacterium]